MSRPNGLSEAIHLTYPEAQAMAIARLVLDGNLYDGPSHRLRHGLTKDKARAILLLACAFARESSHELVLSVDEKKLMASKLELRGSR